MGPTLRRSRGQSSRSDDRLDDRRCARRDDARDDRRRYDDADRREYDSTDDRAYGRGDAPEYDRENELDRAYDPRDRYDDRPQARDRVARRDAPRPRRPAPAHSTQPNSTRRDVRRAPWQGTLLPNPDAGGGNPPYMVVDGAGAKRRYITESDGVDLQSRLHKTAIIHEDTGLILSASQLEFPLVEPTRGRSYDDRYAGQTSRREDFQPANFQDDYRYRFEDEYDDYGRQNGDPNRVYSAQHFEELPPGASYGPPVIESSDGSGGDYELDEFAPSGAGCGAGCCGGGCGGACCGSGGRSFDLLGLGFNVRPGRMFGNRNGCGGCEVTCGDCTEVPAFWASVEYLHWWTDGMYLPPLVTTSPATDPPETAGALNNPNTQILYGNDSILTGSRNGGRLVGGFRVAPRLGLQVDYFGLEVVNESYSATGPDDYAVVSRPLFLFDLVDNADGINVGPGIEQVAYPGVLSGTVFVNTRSDLESAGASFRYGLCCERIDCGDCQPGGTSSIDIIGGYRYMQLDEGLLVGENLVVESEGAAGQTFVIRDSFTTHNDFHGGELGAAGNGNASAGRLNCSARSRSDRRGSM